jgi:hypothetical protein
MVGRQDISFNEAMYFSAWVKLGLILFSGAPCFYFQILHGDPLSHDPR